MIIELTCLLVAIALAVTGSLTFWPVGAWYDFYIPVVLFIGGYLLTLFGFWFAFISLYGCTISYKKEYKKPNKFALWLLMQGNMYICKHANIKYELRGTNKIPPTQRFLLVCNHRSKFDSMLITAYLGKKNIAFITKPSNMKKIPLAPKLLWANLYLPIDRYDKMKSLEVSKKAADYLTSGATSVGVFPEGTRQSENTIGDFHEGMFNIAIHANAPIVVMTSKGTEMIHKNFPFTRTKVRQDVLAVITPEEYADKTAKQLSDDIHKLMEDHLNEIKL